MRRLGNIQCLEKNMDDAAPWVILFHGYGADMHDLTSLAELIHPKKPLNWLFPNGLDQVPLGVGYSGRAWWPIDVAKLNEMMVRGDNFTFSGIIPEGLARARTEAFRLIEQMKIPWNNLILGGFSQGAMLSLDLAMRAPETPRGLILLSGTMHSEPELKDLIHKRAGLKYFQSHGKQDTVLGFKQAQQMETFLSQGGLKGRLMSFNGGHEIPQFVLAELERYLNEIL